MDTRALIMQMCTARLGQGGSPAILKLLEQLGGEASPAVDLRGLLDQIGADNPMARMLADHLEQQKTTQASAAPVIDVTGEVSTSDEQLPPIDDAAERAAHQTAAAAVRDLKAKAESMYAELHVLRERNEELAWALGACPLCWGGDDECRSCRGRGRPGFRFPDARPFLTYVIPAARMWRLKKADESTTQKKRSNPTEQAVSPSGRNDQQR